MSGWQDWVLVGLSGFAVLGCFMFWKLDQALSAYSKGFGAESGKIDAASTKLDDIQNQLSKTVKTTESIKKEIEQGAWREREIETQKRLKLEAYLMCFYEAQDALTYKMQETFFKADVSYDPYVDSKLSMLQLLYLPELQLEHAQFLKVYGEFLTWIAGGQRIMAAQMQAGQMQPLVDDAYMEHYPILLDKLLKSRVSMERKVKELARKINCH